MMKCLHFLGYDALSSLEIVTTAVELSSIITAGSNSGMLSSEHMYMINSLSLTSVVCIAHASQHGWKKSIPESVWHFGCRRTVPLGCRPIMPLGIGMYQVAGVDFAV